MKEERSDGAVGPFAQSATLASFAREILVCRSATCQTPTMARSDSEPGEADVHSSDAQAMNNGGRDPAEILMELEALESLLKDRFDGSTASGLLKTLAVPSAAQHLEAADDRTRYTAFPLFPVRPATQSDPLATSNPRKRKRQDAMDDVELEEQAVAEHLRKEHKKEKKRKRHDKKLMPLVRAESPEPEYPGPGPGRIM